MSTTIKTMKDLRTDLVYVYNQLRENNIPLKEVKEISSLAGKIIGTAKVELTYNIHKANIDKMDFLESGEVTINTENHND